ncbi:hypothetical protein KGP36_07290 [Patescibacteria group bacterium]|nr:hypothetical protein [Patescibacteria group bacterium]
MRTCQQDELYRAENRCNHGSAVSIPELQNYLDSMRETSYWERNFPQVRRVVGHVRKGNSQGSVGSYDINGESGQIEMAPCHMYEMILCHEVAHVLAEARYGSHAHDPWFARTYLELVYSMMGPEAYADLKQSFDDRHIDCDTCNAVPAGRVV